MRMIRASCSLLRAPTEIWSLLGKFNARLTRPFSKAHCIFLQGWRRKPQILENLGTPEKDGSAKERRRKPSDICQQGYSVIWDLDLFARTFLVHFFVVLLCVIEAVGGCFV